MKKIILFSIVTLTLILLTLFIPELASAQAPPPLAPEQAPIDGGLGLLAAAGGAYAVKKFRDKDK